MLPIVKVINKKKRRWFGHVMRKDEESTLRAVMKLNMKRKTPRRRPRLRWLDNIDSHLKGNNTSLKEVLETKCFENRQDWGKLFYRPADRSSGDDNWLLPGAW